MKSEINTFLKSGVLEKYLIGQSSVDETQRVESMINQHPEIKAAYTRLETQLEFVAQVQGEDAADELLEAVLNSIDTTPVRQLQQNKSSSWFKFGIAASVAAFLFAGASFFFYNQNEKLIQENQVVVDELFDLRNDIDQNNAKLEALMQQFAQLNNPETEKYILKGNRRAKNLKTVAYINPKEKTSMIDVVSLPNLPDEKCYQIWADIQGKMVSLGILNETDRRLQKLPYTEDALGLSITIEPKGGSANNSGETPVAEIELKLND